MATVAATVRSVRRVGASTVAIDLEVPGEFDIAPGQFVLVRATVDGEEHARHYTMSSPDATEGLELTVGVDPEGALSSWLAERQPGDTLDLEGPLGRTFYEGDGDVVVYAGGPGIGAGLGVAERARSAGHAAAMVAWIDDGELVHESRLGALVRAGTPVYVSRTPDGFASAVAALEADRPAPTRYVFGFNPFVERTQTAMADASGDPADAQIERYG